jgi:ATP-dependent protease HslVU (ClpYQ) peptidase subunit
MTTLAAVQGEGWAVIGYDSRITEDGRMYQLPKQQGKVVRNGSYLLGAAGDLRAINLLAYVLKPPTPAPTDVGVKLDKFISSRFMPTLKACFDEVQYGEKGEQDSNILVVVNGTVYEIGSGYDWCHDESGIYAVGSGSGYALGSMITSLEGKKRTMTNVRSSIKTAIGISTRLDPNTGEPIHLITQRSEFSKV